MNMLEYSKMILEKVSFDSQLFEKELRKALRQLVGADREDLMRWVATRFGYPMVQLAI